MPRHFADTGDDCPHPTFSSTFIISGHLQFRHTGFYLLNHLVNDRMLDGTSAALPANFFFRLSRRAGHHGQHQLS
ncbi:hypothetical protein [Paenibacillus sp. GbtcB18]|uniref:hypothetical protein n=1 Tax=Paenibacillus sp. GbtcB18 TaxID=2824763 RepID=UPI0020C65333|nr:hypothetical protein [Paenibacillus sp. GbtcB18]